MKILTPDTYNFDESESINNAVKEIFYIPSDRFITIHESKKKGVYDALMHDFRLDFNSKFPS